MKAFAVGDKVAYSVQFLRSIGEITGDLPAGRGVITELTPLGGITLARIEWNIAGLPTRVNACNLAHVGANSRFAAC